MLNLPRSDPLAISISSIFFLRDTLVQKPTTSMLDLVLMVVLSPVVRVRVCNLMFVPVLCPPILKFASLSAKVCKVVLPGGVKSRGACAEGMMISAIG